MRYLDVTETDHEQILEVHRYIDPRIDSIIDRFYEHLEGFPEVSRFIAEPGMRERLIALQREYLLTLGLDCAGKRYFSQRQLIGQTHEQIGLELHWFIGAYAELFSGAEELIREQCDPASLGPLLTTLEKFFLLDMMIAVEAFHTSTTRRLEALLSQLSEAQQRLEATSRIDDLTGIVNRKYLLESLEMEIYRSKRFSHPFTLMMMDVDYFKRVNDDYGHVFGDYALRTVARLAKASLRPSNVLGRYGGEEFAIGMVECDVEVALDVAERVRLKVGLHHFEHESVNTRISVSIGIAQLDPEHDTLEDLIQKADLALYAAKDSGRNCVLRYHESMDKRRKSE